MKKIESKQKTVHKQFQHINAFLYPSVGLGDKNFRKHVKFLFFSTDRLHHTQQEKSNDGFLVHLYNNLREQSNSLKRLSFCIDKIKNCNFSFKTFKLYSDQLVLPEIVILNHQEYHESYKNRFLIHYKNGLSECN